MCKNSFSFLSFIFFSFLFLLACLLLNLSLWRVMKEINGIRRSRKRYWQITTATPTNNRFCSLSLVPSAQSGPHLYTIHTRTNNHRMEFERFLRFLSARNFRMKQIMTAPPHFIRVHFLHFIKVWILARNTEIRFHSIRLLASKSQSYRIIVWLIINQCWCGAFQRRWKYVRLWHLRFPSHHILVAFES